MKIRSTISAIILVALTGSVFGQVPGGSPSQHAHIQHCIVSLIDDVNLPAEQEGVLRVLNVKQGQYVRQGELLGKVDDQRTKLQEKATQHRLAVATEKATNESELKAAKKITQVAEAEYQESVNLNRRGDVIPQTQVRRQKLQWERSILEEGVAETNLDVAKLELKVAEAELEAVRHELKHLEILAPFDGVVYTLYTEQNEWVQPGTPVVRLLRMNRLRVEGFLNVDEYSPDEVLGADVVVTVLSVGGRKVKFQGKIEYVSPLVEASGDYRIWTEVDNRPGAGGYQWQLRPGTEAEMTITLRKATRLGSR